MFVIVIILKSKYVELMHVVVVTKFHKTQIESYQNFKEKSDFFTKSIPKEFGVEKIMSFVFI